MHPLPIVRSVPDLRAQVAAWRRDGLRIGLVPTMGALHEGHLSLVRLALRHADRVVASIFVNPKQFGVGEDFERYPRQEADDAAKLASAGCHLLFVPTLSAMYPSGFATSVSVSGVSDGLCGAARPGHFDGVATVVSKLLNQAQADVAVFGEKDFQQLAVIRRLAADLDIATQIVGAPLLRDPDGLAMSSRNAYLSRDERRIALALPRALGEAALAIQSGQPVTSSLAAAHAALLAAGFAPVDYVELRAEADLAPLDQLDRPARLLAAARVGKTRLIDNLAVAPTANA
jgi:pantoate--beta-alanine ligase